MFLSIGDFEVSRFYQFRMSKDKDLLILLLPHFLITLKNNCANSSAEQTSLTILPSWQFEETPKPFG
jgi:hypothetical protein